MSALSAFEAPVAAPDARRAARAGLRDPRRPLRVVGEPETDAPVVAAAGAVADTQPRSSSIGSARSRTVGDMPRDRAAMPVLVGTVVPRSRPRPRIGADAARPRLRLTRRGRVVVAALVIAAFTLAVLLMTMLVAGGAQATNHGQPRGGYQGMHQVVVRPGQTLWSIAAAAEPTADPRNVVQEIMSANTLSSPTINAGQLLWVP
jgi:LysM domain